MDRSTHVFIFVEDGLLNVYGYQVGSFYSRMMESKYIVSDRLVVLTLHRLIITTDTFNQ